MIYSPPILQPDWSEVTSHIMVYTRSINLSVGWTDYIEVCIIILQTPAPLKIHVTMQVAMDG